jgi:hypothetical protein
MKLWIKNTLKSKLNRTQNILYLLLSQLLAKHPRVEREEGNLFNVFYRYTTSILNIFLELLELLPREFKNIKLNYEVAYLYIIDKLTVIKKELETNE